MSDVHNLRFIHVEDVSGRGLERHDHAITRVMHYRFNRARGVRNLLVHVAGNGLVGDDDLVSR